jgi:hypothetical protein
MRKHQIACETEIHKVLPKTLICYVSLVEKVQMLGPRNVLSQRVFRRCYE